MGNCRSYESSSRQTAKLILIDGKLQEFSYPVKVSDLIQQNPDFFICSSDDMEFGEFAAAVGGDEVLQPGEVYFELPLRWRNHRMQAEDMAALAVKASLALGAGIAGDEMVVECCWCVSRKVKPMMLLFGEKERPLLAAESGGGWVEMGRGRGGGWKFVAELSDIDEE